MGTGKEEVGRHLPEKVRTRAHVVLQPGLSLPPPPAMLPMATGTRSPLASGSWQGCLAGAKWPLCLFLKNRAHAKGPGTRLAPLLQLGRHRKGCHGKVVLATSLYLGVNLSRTEHIRQKRGRRWNTEPWFTFNKRPAEGKRATTGKGHRSVLGSCKHSSIEQSCQPVQFSRKPTQTLQTLEAAECSHPSTRLINT